MSKYCIVNSRVVTSIIEIEPERAYLFDAIPFVEGLEVGDVYPFPKSTDEIVDDLMAENKLLKAQLHAQTERSDFIEDCLAEMATVVYGGE